VRGAHVRITITITVTVLYAETAFDIKHGNDGKRQNGNSGHRESYEGSSAVLVVLLVNDDGIIINMDYFPHLVPGT
jgi:hypothetical protein